MLETIILLLLILVSILTYILYNHPTLLGHIVKKDKTQKKIAIVLAWMILVLGVVYFILTFDPTHTLYPIFLY